VNGPGDDIFANTGLPTDQDRRIGVGDLLDDPSDVAHLRASVEKLQVLIETTLSTALSGRPLS